MKSYRSIRLEQSWMGSIRRKKLDRRTRKRSRSIRREQSWRMGSNLRRKRTLDQRKRRTSLRSSHPRSCCIQQRRSCHILLRNCHTLLQSCRRIRQSCRIRQSSEDKMERKMAHMRRQTTLGKLEPRCLARMMEPRWSHRRLVRRQRRR
jgi:hypothetical protein